MIYLKDLKVVSRNHHLLEIFTVHVTLYINEINKKKILLKIQMHITGGKNLIKNKHTLNILCRCLGIYMLGVFCVYVFLKVNYR